MNEDVIYCTTCGGKIDPFSTYHKDTDTLGFDWAFHTTCFDAYTKAGYKKKKKVL